MAPWCQVATAQRFHQSVICVSDFHCFFLRYRNRAIRWSDKNIELDNNRMKSFIRHILCVRATFIVLSYWQHSLQFITLGFCNPRKDSILKTHIRWICRICIHIRMLNVQLVFLSSIFFGRGGFKWLSNAICRADKCNKLSVDERVRRKEMEEFSHDLFQNQSKWAKKHNKLVELILKCKHVAMHTLIESSIHIKGAKDPVSLGHGRSYRKWILVWIWLVQRKIGSKLTIKNNEFL